MNFDDDRSIGERLKDAVKSIRIRSPSSMLIGIVVALLFIFATLMFSGVTMCVGGMAGIASQKEFTYNGELGQKYAEATETQKKIAEATMEVPTPGAHLCATWVYNVFLEAGFPGVGGHANVMRENYCTSNDVSELKVGMIIAVQHAGYTGDGWTYGHVGIYIGDNQVRHSTTVNEKGVVLTTDLGEWIENFDTFGTVRWGYPPQVATIIAQEEAVKAQQETTKDTENIKEQEE